MAQKPALKKFLINLDKRADGFTNINQLRVIRRNGKRIGYRSGVTTKEYRKGQFVKKIHYQILLQKSRLVYYQKHLPSKYVRKKVPLLDEQGKKVFYKTGKKKGQLRFKLQELPEARDYSRGTALDTLEKGLQEEYGDKSLEEARKRLAAFQVAYLESIEEGREAPDFDELVGSPKV